MNAATASKLTDGTLVVMIGSTDTTGRPLHLGSDLTELGYNCAVGGAVRFVTTTDRVAPAAEVVLPDTVVGAEVRRFTEAAIAWQRKLWIARVSGVFVGEFRTKAEALAAVRVAAGVLAWQQANGDTCEECGDRHPGKSHNRE